MIALYLNTLVRTFTLIALFKASFGIAVPTEAAFSVEARSAIPEDYINEVLAFFKTRDEHEALKSKRKAYDTKRALQKRTPTDQACEHAEEWLRRRCMSDVSPRAWEDECQPVNGGPWYDVDGQCPEHTRCMEVERTVNDLVEDTIDCIPLTPPREDKIDIRGQYGYREVFAAGQSTAKSRTGYNKQNTAIKVMKNFRGASVSAHIGSVDKEYIVNPVGLLTANLRGKSENVCRQERGNSHHDTRTCRPRGRFSFTVGQILDFTFALATISSQEGLLFYFIG